jgi:predicted RNase H-like nuclease (RuvC/YqgF family)
MLDIFKRTHEEGQPPEEPQAPIEPEVPVQIQEAQEAPKTADAPQEEPKVAEESQAKAEENLTTTLETLKQEENLLLNQKQQLESIGEQLRLRTLEEIEKKKQRINALKTEIPELKQKCESLAKALEIPVYNTPD